MASDVLVFAPHPDDEVIGCAGVIQQALRAGKDVRIVFSTDGDGYPRAASVLFAKPESTLTPVDFMRLGETRRREAVSAAAALGVGASSLLFLGFPDGALVRVHANTGTAPVQSPLTARETTDRGTPYTHAAALHDFEEALRTTPAADVYVTDAADEHPDHRATHAFVVEAVKSTGSRARLFTFMVHSGGMGWPVAGPVFESRVIDGVTYPAGVAWPPPIRVALTEDESAIKLRALKAHASQWAIDHEYLAAFVKTEELFWTTP